MTVKGEGGSIIGAWLGVNAFPVGGRDGTQGKAVRQEGNQSAQELICRSVDGFIVGWNGPRLIADKTLLGQA